MGSDQTTPRFGALSAQGLLWTRKEIDHNLSRSAQLIEQYSESSADASGLQQAGGLIQEVRGAALLIRCYGLAMLATEMKLALECLADGDVLEAEALCSALLSATLQASDYLDVLAHGQVDCPLAMQPLINELRLARDQQVLTESDVFVSHALMSGLRLPASRQAGDGAQAQAQRLMPVYLAALGCWLRGQEAEKNLMRVGKVAQRLAQQALDCGIFELWHVVAACVESLLAQRMNDSLALRRLMAGTSHQIRILAGGGEQQALAEIGDRPLRLLYFIGRTRASGPRARHLRQALQLDAMLPSTEFVQTLRGGLRGPNTGLLEKLVEEIRNELAEVKDAVDLALRAESGQAMDFSDTLARFKQLADTLFTLGLDAEHEALNEPLQTLRQAGGEKQVDEATWMAFATSLLNVELSLDEALYRQLMRAAPDADRGAGSAAQNELRQGTAAVFRESLINLARVKICTDSFIRTQDASGLQEAARLLDEVAAGFRIIGADRADQLVLRVQAYLQSTAFARTCADPGAADRFADSVACIEYLLENCRDGLNQEAARLLDRLSVCVDEMSPPGDVVVPVEASADAPASEAESEVAAVAAPESTVEADQAPETVDAQIRDVFLEEADQVLARLNGALPGWMRDAGNQSHLGDVRRAFHILKGSGRMVGAQQIGDFAWAIEKLLNRCLEGTTQVSPAVVDLVREGIALMPRLLSDYRYGSDQPNAGAQALAVRAAEIAKGGGDAEQPGLVDVFRGDALDRLAWLKSWVAEQDASADLIPVEDAVLRAFHTLRGAAFSVGAQAVGELAGGLERELGRQAADDGGVSPALLQLTDESLDALKGWVEAVARAGAATPAVAPWLARLAAFSTPPAEDEDAQQAETIALSTRALDLLQEFDSGLRAWARWPQARFHALKLKSLMHNLRDAAEDAEQQALAAVADRMHQRMGEFAGGPVPDSAFFDGLAAVTEGLNQLLDQLHQGQSLDGTALLAQINALQAQSQTPAEQQPPQDTEALRQAFLQQAPALLHGVEASIAELLKSPQDQTALDALGAALHALRAAARKANQDAVSSVTQRLEMVVSAFVGTGAIDVNLFRARAQAGSHALVRLLAQLQAGDVPDAREALAQIDRARAFRPEVSEPQAEASHAAPQTPAEAAVLQQVAEDIVQETETVDTPAESEPVSRVPVASESASREGAPAAPMADSDLAGIFAPEAAELLEALQQHFSDWAQDPGAQAPQAQMQRALHTFKGGARMAGLHRMGSAAHHMETRIARLAQSGQAPDAGALQELRQSLEQLFEMLDQLERGQLQSLLQAEESEPEDLTPVTAPSSQAPPPEPEAAPLAGGRTQWDRQLFWHPEAETQGGVARLEQARVPVERLDAMLNRVGEISIFRSRMEEGHASMVGSLHELEQTISRVREQLRMMDIETEAQIAARGFSGAGAEQPAGDRYEQQFDPLEMDRYSRMQELSRALAESVNDLLALHAGMQVTNAQTESLLQQQGRVGNEVQQWLMDSLMVPFSRQVQRLERVIRQTAEQNGKQARAEFVGVESELDRMVLERMTAPLEHLLRNAVVHGIEDAQQRLAAGKGAEGLVRVELHREGSQLIIQVRDDGRGFDYQAIRQRAIERGLLRAEADVDESDLARLVFSPGFTTAGELTQDAGRGVGLDVVESEVRQLGGTIGVQSGKGGGSQFTVRLPLALSISQALLVEAGEESFALPLAAVEGVVRIPRAQIARHLEPDDEGLPYGEHRYQVRYLSDLVGRPGVGDTPTRNLPAILVRLDEAEAGVQRGVAVVVDHMIGNREIVSKAVGPILGSISGISGATILADGRVVLMLDIPALVRAWRRHGPDDGHPAASRPADVRDLVMVVDDSITMRRVAERLLTRNGYRVITARDGLDAMAQLQSESPAAVLLDIEMPRADGFEVAAFVRNTEAIAQVPIIMISSRSGDKHRAQAKTLGVNRYMVKPYQEDALLACLRELIQTPVAV